MNKDITAAPVGFLLLKSNQEINKIERKYIFKIPLKLTSSRENLSFWIEDIYYHGQMSNCLF